MAVARHLIKLPDSVRAKGPRLRTVAERVRSRHLFIADVIGVTVTSILALAIWFDAGAAAGSFDEYLWVVGIVVASRAAINIAFGLYTASWRFASVADMARILACSVIGTGVAAGIVFVVAQLSLSRAPDPPAIAFWALELALAVAVVAAPRFLVRAAFEFGPRAYSGAQRERTLLYGAGWAGVIVARSAVREPDSGVTPVGFLDDNPALRGRRVAGLLVYGGIEQLARAQRRSNATVLLITMPGAPGEVVRGIVDAAMQLGLSVRTVPPVTDLIDGTVDATRIRNVRVEDLLRRPLARDHSPAVGALVKGQTVMVTGAAGSIGSELVRQLLALSPQRVVLVDQAESALYMFERSLEGREQILRGTTTVSTHLLDIRDRVAIAELMADKKPVVVFHAAAYKHVPMLEDHVEQAVQVNIGGTMSVVDAAVACDVRHFVLVSTDKAVRPSSVMGATKRAAEMIVADAARRTARPYVSVRFGNVLGSNGSVIPVFQEQLEQGQPLTITDPEMTRYFMTIPEASWLIVDAAALSETGSLFVLDMGEPVRIMDIANDLVRLSGRDPATVPMRFVGLRPGEKLHEELFYDQEDVVPTAVPKVLRSRSSEPLEDLREHMTRLLTLARERRSDELSAALHEYVRMTLAPSESTWKPSMGGVDPALKHVVGYREAVVVPIDTSGNGRTNGARHRKDEAEMAGSVRSREGD